MCQDHDNPKSLARPGKPIDRADGEPHACTPCEVTGGDRCGRWCIFEENGQKKLGIVAPEVGVRPGMTSVAVTMEDLSDLRHLTEMLLIGWEDDW